MSLYSRSFVRGLRRRARVETKLHPKWKAEARATRKSARRVAMQRTFRFLVPLAAIGLAASPFGVLLALPVLLIWSTTLMFARAAQIQSLVFAHSDSVPFYQFPVTERFVFARAARRLFLSSLWLVADAFFLLATVAIRIHPGEVIGDSVLFAVLAALGIWLATLAGAHTLVWIRPGFPFGVVSGCAFSFGWIGLWIASKANWLSPATMYACYENAKWCVPSGWVCVLIEPWLESTRATLAAPFALLASLGFAGICATRVLQSRFTFWQSRIEPDSAEEEPPEAVPVSRVSDVEDAIASRDFLDARDWTGGGFIERTAARWLTLREHRVMDLALTVVPCWTRRFPKACILVLAAPCLAWLARGVVSQPGWIQAFGTLAGLGMLTPLFGGGWSAFTPTPLANRATAVCNLWPVSLREMRSCILKINFVRYLFALPCWLFAGGAAAAALGDAGLSAGILIAGKCWLLSFALQPFFLAFKYSASTNDTSSGCLFVLAMYAMSFAIVAAAGTAFVLSFIADRFYQWLPAAAVLAIFSWFFEVAYRRAWRAQQFDLLAKSNASGFQ